MAGRDRTNTYILLAAIVVALVAGYYLPTRRAETGASMTPREYLDLVEQKQAQRQRYADEQQGSETGADGASGDVDGDQPVTRP